MECASTDPDWDDEFWKVQTDDGTLSTVETSVAGAISMNADGSWTNENDDDPVFRIVLKVGAGVGADQVLSGVWEPGEGGTIDLSLTGLAHVTFCFSDDVDDDDSEEPEPTTTTTTSPGSTTTTAAEPTTTTATGPTTTTIPDAETATTPGESTATPASDETTTNEAASTTGVTDAAALSSEASESDESGEEADGSQTSGTESFETEESLPDADRDPGEDGPVMVESGEPPALGQAPIPSNAASDAHISDEWPTLVDLAILGALIAAIAVLILIDRGKLDFRRLVEKAHLGRWWG